MAMPRVCGACVAASADCPINIEEASRPRSAGQDLFDGNGKTKERKVRYKFCIPLGPRVLASGTGERAPLVFHGPISRITSFTSDHRYSISPCQSDPYGQRRRSPRKLNVNDRFSSSEPFVILIGATSKFQLELAPTDSIACR